MALATTLAVLMMAQGPALVVDGAASRDPNRIDVAFGELVNGENSAAIERIENNDRLEKDDPARLINLGIAHARQGREIVARQMFSTAMYHQDRYSMETASGEWVDSRNLAREALAMLERGEFASGSRMAAR